MEKLKPLDPNIPYQKKMIENIKKLKDDPLTFMKKVLSIFEEARLDTCKRYGLPLDFRFNPDIIIATTEDGYIFMCREDLLDVLREPEWYLGQF